MTDQNTSFKNDRYPSLNGLRAISIIIVILCHLSLYHQGVIPPFIISTIPLLFDGFLGVNIFFVISGFLITGLLLKEEALNGSISFKKFYARRTLRIFPAYYFLLFVYFILTRFQFIYISNESWLTALTYTKYFNWKLDSYTGHAWSLSVEEHFYLLWPLLFVIGRKTRKVFIVSILILTPALKTFLYYHQISWINNMTIFYRFDAIATGCLFALYQEKIIEKMAPHFRKIFYISILALILLSYSTNINLNYHLHLGFLIIPFGSTYGSFANFIIAFIMMVSVFGPKSKWFSFLNSKTMNQIGLWSYSLYLWQEIFIMYSDHFINQLPFSLLFIFIAAIGSYYLIEQPFLKLKKRFSFQKQG